MTELTINRQRADQSFKENDSLLSAAEKILNDKSFHDSVLMNLTIDGQTVEFDQEESFFKTPISEFKNVDFHLVSSVELAFEALDSCSGYVDNLSLRINRLVEFYRENEVQKADTEFAGVVELLDLFVQLVSNIHSTLNRFRPEIVKNTEGIQKLEIHLLSVMKAVLAAKEKSDIIMLCDLLEYELIDNLTQWKINIIPQFKKLKTN